MNRTYVKNGLVPGIIVLLIVPIVTPMAIGYDNVKIEKSATSPKSPQSAISSTIDSPWPMFCHDSYHTGRSLYGTSANPGLEKWRFETGSFVDGSAVIDNDGVIYFGSWDNYLYALNNNGTEKWRAYVGNIETSPAIDENGVIYVMGDDSTWTNVFLYAFYPNSTLKWKYKAGNRITSSTIGNDGTIYFGDDNGYLNALYPNGTLKWKYLTTDYYWKFVRSSPAIGDDGTIYCGACDGNLFAFYPNGTVKWKYKTGNWVRKAPSIADDGAIYFCSYDGALYAVHQNGTLKWKKDGLSGTDPVTAQDGTIYIGNEELKALYPNNGTVKWKFNANGDIYWNTPAICADGIIYFGTDTGWFYAVNPDGTERWKKKLAGDDKAEIRFAPAIDKDGTVYVGSRVDYEIYPGSYKSKGYLHAFGIGEFETDAHGPYYALIDESINFTGSANNGTEPYSWHWNFGDGSTSDEKNTAHVYITSGDYTVTLTVTDSEEKITSDATVAHIFESNTPPNTPNIYGPTSGKVGAEYTYASFTTDSEKDQVYYWFDWNDKTNSGWLGPYNSGTTVTAKHTWTVKGKYEIKVKAKDDNAAESDWATLEVSMPKNRAIDTPFIRFLDDHPRMFPLLQHLLGL